MAGYASLDHSNLQGHAIGITFAFPVLATLAVGLRFYSRSLTRTFGAGMSCCHAAPTSILVQKSLRFADDITICVAAVSPPAGARDDILTLTRCSIGPKHLLLICVSFPSASQRGRATS